MPVRQPGSGSGPQSRSSKDAGVMHLLRCLIFEETHLGCHLYGQYIDTDSNHLADDLSQNRAFSFLSKVPSVPRRRQPACSNSSSIHKPTGCHSNGAGSSVIFQEQGRRNHLKSGGAGLQKKVSQKAKD